MKKALIVCLLTCVMLSCTNFPAMAKDTEVTAVIPDYQIVIDNSSIYYADSIYPFLNYKGITYMPMTYEYCRAMNLTTGWLEGAALMVAYNPSYDSLPVYGTTNNQKYNRVALPTGYRIYVNGKKVDNAVAEYPLLNFRGVTYFPMTWEYSVENFGWQLSFENNILKINTDDDRTVKRWTLEEKRENDAVLSMYYDKEILQDDGTVKNDYITEYLSLDYKSGETKQIDYTPLEGDSSSSHGIEVVVNDGNLYYKDQKLDDIHIAQAEDSYVQPDDIASFEYSVNAYASDKYVPLNVIEVNVRTTTWKKNGSGQGTNVSYTYIDANDKIIPLGRYKTVENVYTLGDDIYFNTVDYGQTIFRHYLHNKRMWKLSGSGELSEIRYADYNSMEIIGKANDELYLKCLWAPENHGESDPYSVSLVNDGYYTFDGNGIRLVSPYIYSDFDIVSDDGDIFAVNNKLDKITKCKINPEYY